MRANSLLCGSREKRPNKGRNMYKDENRNKQTHRDRFLEEFDRSVQWQELEAVIAPYYTQDKAAEHPQMDLLRMLKIYTAQQCFGLSDAGAEDAIYDSLAIRRFVGMDHRPEFAPEETTILHFRQFLEKHNLTNVLYEKINRHLAAKGFLLQKGSAVDATLINYQSSDTRKVVIYGSGDYGIVTVFHLRSQGVTPEAFIDEITGKIELKTGLSILKPSDVLCGETKPYVIIADPTVAIIKKMIVTLEQYGLKSGEDFELSIFSQFLYDTRQLTFVIYAFPYDENIGGIIALYQLHKLLIKHGFNSKICICGAEKALPSLTNHNIIAVYPEGIDGNPLKVKNVVRWLLYKPKVHNPNANFSENELTFCYDKRFNDININPDEYTLTLIHTMWETYKQTNFGKREGNCYIIRKGGKRADLPKNFDGHIIDGKPHKEIAQIFNECEYCICYDPATMYADYARMCGCIPVIMPDNSANAIPVLTKAPWIAYGNSTEEILRSRNSKNILIEHLQSLEKDNDQQVLNFVDICRKRFGIS